jgi:hypothetical protein
MDGRASVVGKHSDTRTGGERASSMRAILYVRTISNRSLPLPGAGSRQRSTVDSFAFSLFAFVIIYLLLVSRYQSDMV